MRRDLEISCGLSGEYTENHEQKKTQIASGILEKECCHSTRSVRASGISRCVSSPAQCLSNLSVSTHRTTWTIEWIFMKFYVGEISPKLSSHFSFNAARTLFTATCMQIYMLLAHFLVETRCLSVWRIFRERFVENTAIQVIFCMLFPLVLQVSTKG
jgi:hypothetical protein